MSESGSNTIESHYSRILVADDDASIRELLRVHLTKAGYDIAMAVDGADAVEKARESLPDLILIDALMPHLDGYEATARLKGSDATSSIPILMISALGAPTDRARALDIGVDDFLNKPFDRIELLSRVRSLLRVRRLHSSLTETNEELQKAYESARDSQARYQSLVNDAIDAVFVVDADSGKIIECNQSATELAGIDAASITQYAIGDLIEDATRVFTLALDTPALTGVETTLRSYGGTAVPVSVRCSRVKCIFGHLDQFTVRDLTLQRQIQAERLEVERLNAILQTAIAVNDEVNNPLSVILGNAEYVHKNLRDVDPAVVTRINNILAAVNRIHEVMTKLTHVVRPVTKEYLPGMEMLDLESSVAKDGEKSGESVQP